MDSNSETSRFLSIVSITSTFYVPLTKKSFSVDHSNATMWLFYDNTQLLTYCQRHQVVAANPSGLDIEIGTKDFVIEKDYILQYSVSGCCWGPISQLLTFQNTDCCGV